MSMSLALQQQHARSSRTPEGDAGASANRNTSERLYIHRIHTADIVSGLHRLPAAFYVVVEIGGKTARTSNKSVSVWTDAAEWDEIMIPIVYATFVFGQALGNGELVGKFGITVREVFDRSEEHDPTFILVQRDNEVLSSCSASLTIITRRCACDVNDFDARFHLSEPEPVGQLEELTNTGQVALTRYRQFQNQRDLDQAIMYFERVLKMCTQAHPSRPTVLSNLATAMFIRCQVDKAYVDLDAPITLYRSALKLRASNTLDYCATALDLSFALLARFQRRADEADRIEAMNLLSTVLELSPAEGYGHHAACLAMQMAEISVSIQTLESEIPKLDSADSDEQELLRRARAALWDFSVWDPRRSAWLACLGKSLYRRFYTSCSLADLDEAIMALENALRHTSDGHPEKPSWLNSLGGSLFCRFESTGDLADLDKSVSMYVEAVRLTPDGHASEPTMLNNLGSSLSSRFERLGDPMDIDRSISMFEKVVRITPDGHPDKPAALGNLGNSLSRRFERLGDLADINRSISVQEDAVSLTANGHPNRQTRLNNLGNSYLSRFERLGNLLDLNKSIGMFDEAVKMIPAGHLDKPVLLSNLGDSLSRRFEHLGDLADINKSISMQEEAVRLTRDGHPKKPTWLNNLGNSLLSRFERLGDLADINRSISMQGEAVRRTPDGHPDKPVWSSNLGSSLFRRFEYLGGLGDITESILMKEEAVRLTPDGHPDKPTWLNNLGNSLLRRFERIGDIADLNRSVSMQEEVFQLSPVGHPDKLFWMNSLGNSLLSRFEHLGDVADLDRSIVMFEEAVRCTRNCHPNKAIWLNNLGSSLLSRFEYLGNIVDVNKAISMFEKAVRLTTSGNPKKPARLHHLGNAFMVYFRHSHNPSSLSAATLHFSAATRMSAGPTCTRFLAARSWISSVCQQGNHNALLDAYATTIELLPELAWLGLPLAERHRVLLQAADVVRDAVAAALEADRPEMAVEWLEQGRSVVWGQFMQLRTAVDELCVMHPTLADRFRLISQELEHAGSRESAASYRSADNLTTPHSTVLVEREMQRHHDLALKREKLLFEIRSLPGFERFLLPKKIEQLVTPVHGIGPIVYLNASKQRCDALIVCADSGKVVPVSLDVSYREVEQLQILLRLLLKRSYLVTSRDDASAPMHSKESLAPELLGDALEFSARDSDVEVDRGVSRALKVKPQRIEGCEPDDLFKQILACLWKKVVKPILKALGLSTLHPGAGKRTHIFWCPTGPFAFLPLHAAGHYENPEAGSKLSDFAISSYTPALSVLAPTIGQDCLDRPTYNVRLSIVSQPSTDGLTWLAFARTEIDHIKTSCTRSQFITLQESDGTIEDVMECMRDSDWIHFACHGVQDQDNPLDSGLCLADCRRLKLSDIIRLSRPRRGGLAFLSACQTAQGDERLSEESVHLAAGMLLAGYRGVVATMWAIQDTDASMVTEVVYEHLFREGKVPDSAEAAEALQYAVQRLRDSGAPFSSWVPFIHLGR